MTKSMDGEEEEGEGEEEHGRGDDGRPPKVLKKKRVVDVLGKMFNV